ncbi:fatty acid desaturase-domain-containing protein [Phlyctochytrium arcticum]|nr:fatty acid desaturase-domain-containing protein [Phlyctochytrium arcticum]
MCYTDARTVSASALPKRSQGVYTQKEIDQRVAEGETLVIIKDRVYNLTKFLKHHPGGDLAIIHMNGRDATDAVLAYHPEEVIEKKMPHYCIGELAPECRHTSAISADYRRLDAELKQNGMYKTNYQFYVLEAVKLVALFVGAWSIVLFGPNHWFPYMISALMCSTMWHQAAFVAHDAGHSGITHDAKTDMKLGIYLGNIFGGLSVGWWKNNHNVHHIVTNDPEHDPDIQHMPFFAISTKFFNSIYSSYYKKELTFDAASRFMISIQHYTYYVLLCFGRFNLYRLGWMHVLRTDQPVPFRRLEITGMTIFWCWFIPLLSFLPNWKIRVAYILLSHMMTVFLHLQITLSHFGMAPQDTPQDNFAAMALKTTMDVDCPTWMDWFHGGLQYQVEHHLFPRLPRHNLRKIRPIVVEFAERHGLPFHSYGFIKSNSVVIDALRAVAHQVHAVIRVDPVVAHQHSQ